MSHRVPDDVNVSVNSVGYSRSDKFAARLRKLRPSPRPHPSSWLANAEMPAKRNLLRFKFNTKSRVHWILLICAGIAAGLAAWLPAFGFFVGGIVLTMFALSQEEYATHHDLGMLEDVDETEQFLAHVDIFQLKYLGSDRGVMWVENGALHFCGSASSFVLGPQDFSIRPLASRQSISLNLKGPIQSSWIVVKPLRTPEGKDRSAPFELVKTLHESPEVAGIPRQWPPLTPRPKYSKTKTTQKPADLQEAESFGSQDS